jgi:pyruvate dehydrogenase E2 component (dihydrolipoamide acetyltransferase)
MAEFQMPSLGADMKKGILVEWKVKPGDHVKRGDIIADVETEKGIIEIEVFEDGIVDRIIVQPNTEVPVGTVMATIRSEEKPVVTEVAEAAPEKTKPAAEKKPESETVFKYKACNIARHREREMAKRAREAQPSPEPAEKRIKISPSARKLADEHGIDISTINGTGPGGAINRADIERAVAAKKPVEKPPAPEKPKPVTADFQAGMRRAIAAAMTRSNRDIPHYYLETRIDMSRALDWLKAENLKRSVKERLLPAVLLLKAVALALEDVPELNGYWIDDTHQVQEAVNIGFAIALRQGGLITPAIHHVDLKSLDELMASLHDLIKRTRTGRLRGSEMTDATITVTNLGDMGVETVYGVIYPPQVALVGLGKITDQPWVENGMLGIRPVLTATLAADHRATDGRIGARFLEAFNNYLQKPERL